MCEKVDYITISQLLFICVLLLFGCMYQTINNIVIAFHYISLLCISALY